MGTLMMWDSAERNPFLSSTTQNTEMVPPRLGRGRESGKRQIKISNGIDGTQFLITPEQEV